MCIRLHPWLTLETLTEGLENLTGAIGMDMLLCSVKRLPGIPGYHQTFHLHQIFITIQISQNHDRIRKKIIEADT